METHNKKNVRDDCFNKKGSKLVSNPPRKKVAKKKTVPCFSNVSIRKEKANPINKTKLIRAPKKD